MPEGDTVWLTARRLDAALKGRPLTVCDVRVPQLATLDLRGRTVLEVAARGKHLLARLDDATTLHSHLRMDGSYDITRAGRRSRRYPDHLIRLLLGNDAWLATGYRIHDLRLLPTAGEAEMVGHLGPDLLGPDWDEDQAVRRLAAQPDVPVGEALLDQRNLAGIGNLYKCEALFLTGVHPYTAVGAVPDLRAVVRRARRLLLANRDHPEQSTTGMLARGRQHYVYGRAGEACLRCRTPIVREVSGTAGPATQARSSYWCPRCQPAAEAQPGGG